MFYYEVFLASPRYQKMTGLTYAHESDLTLGLVVSVRLQAEMVLGVINKKVPQPSFKTQLVIRIVSDIPLPTPLLKLRAWLTTYYPAPSGTILGLLIPKNLIQQERVSYPEKQKVVAPKPSLPKLTPEQQAVLAILLKSSTHTALLHGDTGTGKTRIYIELAKQQLDNDKSVIVLTPEIGLTPQLVENFTSALDYEILHLHSNMSPVQRRSIWLKCLQTTTPLIIIGPRSALFVPLRSVGIIIVDEAHDGSYKQEQAPYYQATRVAARLAKLHAAKLVLGTATPLIEDYYYFVSKNLPILRMTQPAKGHYQPIIRVVALHDRTVFTRSFVLSNPLLEQFKIALDEGHQSFCFINRRGTARIILCQQCGWQANCPHCELPLTFHDDTHEARCHTCGFYQNPPLKCSQCGSSEIIYRTPGTKAIANELKILFPYARIERFDSDNLTAERLEKRFQAITSGSVDILVGTQILAKGLDIPRLSSVGIVSADTSLNFPDYTAEERTYQLLAQVIGRVSRGHIETSVVVQTSQPDSITLKSAIQRDYKTFYDSQVHERQLFRLPPFCFILKLQCGRASARSATHAAQELTDMLRQKYSHIEIIGPAPSFREKSLDKYYWQLIIKSKSRLPLLAIIDELPRNWRYDIDPLNLL